MLEKVKSRLHVRGKCCASCVFSSSFFFSSFFFTETVHTHYAGIESRLPHFNFLEICRSSQLLFSPPSFSLSLFFLSFFNFNLESGLHVEIIFNTTEHLVRNCFGTRMSSSFLFFFFLPFSLFSLIFRIELFRAEF